MKRVIVSGACVMALLSSCKKYLEHSPDNRAALTTPAQVSQLLGTAYPQANYMAFTESISDNVSDKGAGTLEKTNIDPYFFNDVRDNQQDSPEYYWYACYAAIAAANQALATIGQAGSDSAYTAQKGEALVARAYAHFMLVTLFSKAYDPATASSDPGIPYVTSPEKVVFGKYQRKTVSYVYDMIMTDLESGLPLIDDRKYSVPRYHFTKAAAHAFAARFYLFKKDYNRVVQHVNQVFSTGNPVSVLRPWNTVYKSLTYQELLPRYASATEPANLLLVETQSLWARNYYTVRYAMDNFKRDEILGNNATGGVWSFRSQLFTAGTNNYLIAKINEYFVRSSVNATIGFPYVMVPLFTTEEALFNRAEANVFLNNPDAAVADLNMYASTRIDSYDASRNGLSASWLQTYYGASSPQAGVFAAIMDFKRAEFVQEGMRWFDLLRYKVPVTHIRTDGASITLTATDLRRVFQLPETVKTSGLDLNPR